jgi:hypothetical protein
MIVSVQGMSQPSNVNKKISKFENVTPSRRNNVFLFFFQKQKKKH